MDSMADLTRKLGWIAWCIAAIGWFASPIISQLVNKLFAYIDFDAPTKLKDLEDVTIPSLKHTLDDVNQQMVLRAAEDKGSQSNLKILDSMQRDLMSALYEAEDILDLRNYRRIEKGIYLGDEGSRRWVEHKLDAACAWIARCKGRWFGRWIDITLAAVMKSAQSVTRQGQFLIQWWRHWRPNIDLFCSCRAVNIVLQCNWYQQLQLRFRSAVAVLKCAQSWYQHLHQRWPGALLPVSDPAPQSLESGGSVSFVPVHGTRRPAEEMVDEEEIMEETQVVEGEAEKEKKLEIENSEEGVMPEEIEEGCGEVGDTSEDKIEDGEKGKEGEPTSSSVLQNCARSMLTLYVKACLFRDWSYEIVGIKSDKEDFSVAECLVPITERFSLRNRIKRIEDILNTSKKSDLLTEKHSGSGKAMDAGKEGSNFTVKNSDKESSSKQKEIDKLYRSIEQKVFGRDKDRDHISRILREGPGTNAASSSTSKSYFVIGIYGITGSGKSTLAQYVCDYEKVAKYFNLIMFILVGETFRVDDIFRDMLEQITQSRRPTDEDPTSLKTKLVETLRDKRFLLVLDDLWVNDDNQKGLDILLDMLNAAVLNGSRVLVTSQKTDAAEALGAQVQISIPDLEEGVYLSLFMHHARPSHASVDDGEYERIGRKIANRLGRSPIAAVTVGKRLQRNKRISFWETTANLDVLNKTMGALWWSYQQLGVDVRRCFTYCSIFPKGYGINRDKMVRMWVAQGFVNNGGNATQELEDVGQHYFDELLTFSFLHSERKNSFMRFTIHDLLYELAKRVSGSEFYRIGLNGLPKDIPQGVHHLFIETDNVAEIVEKILYLGNLRTLIINECSFAQSWVAYSERVGTMERIRDLEKVLGRLFEGLRKLRVLTIWLNYRRYELSVSVPESIYHMKHLRYLCFVFHVPRVILPSTFSKLYHIQSTDIPDASYPEDMANLTCWRDISGWLSGPIPNIGRLTSLQRLPGPWFEVKQGQGYELKQLMHLNKLRGNLSIQGLEFIGSLDEALEAQLNHKEGLRRLELNFGSSKRFGPDVEAKVLEGLCPPKDLHELLIEDYKGSSYPSWMLSPEDSKSLIGHKLKLKCCSQLASIPKDSKFFIGLRELIIFECDWDSLPKNMECLLSLQTLEISFCHNMKHVPKLPVQSLQKIIIVGCLVLSRTCNEKGHEDWHKIKDIPEKLIMCANIRCMVPRGKF